MSNRPGACPFCAMDISADEVKCPHCGGRLKSNHVGETYPSFGRERQRVSWALVFGVLMSLVVVPLSLGAILVVASMNSEEISELIASEIADEEPRALPSPLFIDVNIPVQGELTSRQNSLLYAFTITRPGNVRLDVESDFDNYLELYRFGETTPFHQDDDSGSGQNASLEVTLESGEYAALVRPYSSNYTGHFTLLITAPRNP